MYKFPHSINELIESFRSLPGVGKKTAERYALTIINQFKTQEIEEFINNLNSVKENITTCEFCGLYKEKHDKCYICDNFQREQNRLLICDSVNDVIAIEKLNVYNGLYFVLNGNIIKNQNVVNKRLDVLLNYLREHKISEIILANNATIEGETTAFYLKEMLKDDDYHITRLAYGLPVGQDLEFADTLTLLKAFEGRKNF